MLKWKEKQIISSNEKFLKIIQKANYFYNALHLRCV